MFPSFFCTVLLCSVRFLTGHSRKGGEDPLHVAESAADPDSTLVIYMGLATLPGIVGKLVENGLPASTPAVAVERGTTPWQRNVSIALFVLHCAYCTARRPLGSGEPGCDFGQKVQLTVECVLLWFVSE